VELELTSIAERVTSVTKAVYSLGLGECRMSMQYRENALRSLEAA